MKRFTTQSKRLQVRTIGEIARVPDQNTIPVQTMFLTVTGQVLLVPIGSSHLRNAGVEIAEGVQFSAILQGGLVPPNDLSPRNILPIEQLESDASV